MSFYKNTSYTENIFFAENILRLFSVFSFLFLLEINFFDEEHENFKNLEGVQKNRNERNPAYYV